MVKRTVEVVKVVRDSVGPSRAPLRDLFAVDYKITLSHNGDQSTTYHQAHFLARDELEAYQKWDSYRGEKYEGD